MFSSLPFMAFVPANPISGKFQNHSSLIRTLCEPCPQLQLMSNETCYDFSILLCIIDQKNKFKQNSVRPKRHFGFLLADVICRQLARSKATVMATSGLTATQMRLL